MKYNSIIETIGDTPLIRLNKVNKGFKGEIYVKVEYFNPGNSMKDRMAIKMVEDAEKEGLLKPGGTIIEGTSGNTGMGLALVGIARGYKCIFTMADKQSKEKIDVLKAMGAEVIVCPTNVPADDPKSYYSVAKKLNKDIPNSFYPNQYDNLSNWKAHYETTGPEIWEDTEGKITHYAAGVGTGGSMCGAAKYLKEQNPKVISIGIDTYGSVFKKFKETGVFDENEIYPYLTEGIGEDILPKNVDFSLIDHFVKVTDKDAAVMTRRLSREEGLFVGWSCGAAVHGALEFAKENLKENDTMVIILPDHGTRYLGKVYNDDWMKDHGFLEYNTYGTARDIISSREGKYELVVAHKGDKVKDAIAMMNERSVSQIPVMDDGHVIGSITDNKLLSKIIKNPELKDLGVEEVMENSMKFVALDSTLDVLSSMVDKDKAVLVRDDFHQIHIITKHDILGAFTK
ncbi:pyridoxal-phosphate dependent enzyme [Echinicola jeungdonensis]|uniref:Pyridoxal-phosphate dependent enzyme n=1 Tax=Echinicola jeungdonensis TaxID=709343 RepID=A0ABV5J7W9_9BACT|nr:pyridoxal-phosphate dependent enzyme [Echinicola jeungdonensis]MDN3670011.1 pyridoxal-phosphate dependent enzyme [Echinicola jeungdonensis]